MYRIALVNMPFASADMPSIALTQLKAVLRSELGDQVECQVFYPNLDFVGYLGPHLYELISNTVQANTSGLGDWFFSQEAFPEKPDESDAYLVRYFSEHRSQLEAFRGELTEKRQRAGAALDELIDLYRLDGFSLVGFTTMFSQNMASIAMARKLKAIRPEIVIVMGGANCESPMGDALARNVREIDFVFSGPSLVGFPRLVGHLLRGEGDECHQIRGVLSQRKLAAQQGERRREIGDELDISVDLPLDYDDYFSAFDAKVPREANYEPKVMFETSRGCWWGERSHCTFCGLNGVTMTYRALPADKALSLLHGLFERYGARASEFKSVDNILPREYLTSVLPYLETPEGKCLFYEIKADLKEREMAVLAQARVTKIQPGIEALATSSLKLMRKGTTSFQNLKFLKHCQRYGINAMWNLLVGFPNEPEEVYRKYYDDLPLLVHFEPPTGSYPIRFDRFSPYYMLAKEYGLKLKPFKWYEMLYPFPPGELDDLAYFFVDEDYKAIYIANTARWLGKLRERIAHWHVRYFQRDRRLKPELTTKERRGAKVVYDSRSGSVVEHVLSPAAWKILDLLEDQHRIPRLVERLEGVPEKEVSAEVAWLKQRGLLFEEDGIYLSLVLRPEKPVLLHALPAEAARQVSLPVAP
ncbi:MAG TPA: RiPP maturation radical SAM C-methyltransferase [Thermoanaerobaculia bacterium]|nr:RiPP maturation radical SAM C-methyltransferase [Thermoanaerobaculia bacterium]